MLPLYYLNGNISVKFHLTKVCWAKFHQWRICKLVFTYSTCTTSLRDRIKKKRDSFWRQKWHRFLTLTDSHSAAVIKLQYFVKSLFLIKISVFFLSYNSEIRTDSRLLCGKIKLNNWLIKLNWLLINVINIIRIGYTKGPIVTIRKKNSD